MELKFRGAGLDHCSASGESPAAWRMRDDGIGSSRIRLPGALRTGPPVRFSSTIHDDSVNLLPATIRLKLKAVTFVAAPGPQVDLELSGCAGDGDRPAG